MSKYLKKRQEYENSCDRFTVWLCRRRRRTLEADFELQVQPDKTSQNPQVAKRLAEERMREALLRTMLIRHEDKKGEIVSMMAGDRKRDQMIAKAVPPSDVKCPTCSSKMAFEFLTFDYSRPDVVQIFNFTCPNRCKSCRKVLQDGTDYLSEVRPCPECSTKLKSTNTDPTDIVSVVTYECEGCGYTELLQMPGGGEKDPDYEKDRARYCLTDEQAQKYIAIRKQFPSEDSEV